MLIDIHAHIGSSLKNETPARRIATYAGTCNVDVVLLSNRDGAAEPVGAENLDETDANAACLDACGTDPRLAPLYWVRAGKLDSNAHAFAGGLATEPFLGAVFSPVEVGFDVADKLLNPYMAVLARAKRPALFCVHDDPRATPSKVYELASRYPQVPIILCVSSGAESAWAAALDAVCYARRQQNANLYLATSHASAEEIATAIQAGGDDRILFGSDALSYGETHIPRHIALLEDLKRRLSAEAYRKFAADNAVRLYGPGLQARALS